MTRTLMLSASGALMAASFIIAGMASAQTMTTTSTSTTSSSGVLSTSSATATKKKPTSATPDMINEAIQRSEARAAKEAASGVPQKWGSEEPFTYNPTVKRFDKSMQ
jgi:hypothetical protein